MTDTTNSRPSVPSSSEAPTQGSGRDRLGTEGAKNLWVQTGYQWNVTSGHDQRTSHLKVMHWNAEGVHKKKLHLANRLKEDNIDVVCIQETHLTDNLRFSVRGYQVFRHDRAGRSKGGVMMLVKNCIPAVVKRLETNDQSEMQEATILVNNQELKVYNVYCPVDKELSLHTIPASEDRCLIVGDFNSHSEMWGYTSADKRGEEVEDWQIDAKMVLLNDPDDQATFYSRRWCSSSTPDLAFATDDISRIAQRKVDRQLSTSDHRPVILSLDFNYKFETKKALPRWNYKKADWPKYKDTSDIYLDEIRDKCECLSSKVEKLNKGILKAAQETIPRGCRKDYRPFWTEELGQAEKNVEEARKNSEDEPSVENNIKFKAATAKLKQVTSTTAKQGWHKKTEGLQLDKSGHKLWKLCKSLNNEQSSQAPVILQENDELIHGKEAARRFVEKYESTSHIDIPRSEETETKKAMKECQNGGTEEMNIPFTMQELETALRSIKEKRAPGIDGVTGEMLKNLGPMGKRKLLQLFNESWRTGVVPQCWRDAEMVPIPKPEKDKSSTDGYRPISLTSCVGKVIERMINTRLVYFLEKNHLINDNQAAFRKHRSTEDQITYLSQVIEDGFQQKKSTLIVWVDLEKAFDQVWKNGLMLKLAKTGIGGKMLPWIGQFLQNRTARVRLGRDLSQKKILKDGLPQGGVLSPTLFTIFVNDIFDIMPRRINATMYADDLAIFCTEETIETAGFRMQDALEALDKYAKKWHVKVSESKTKYTIFSLSTKIKAPRLEIKQKRLQEDTAPRYLGVVFDPRLTWKHNIAEIERKGKARLNIMKKMSGTTWGADMETQKKLYVGYVRPILEYGASAATSTAPSNTRKIDRLQNQALRIMTGSMKSTPIDAMETTTGIQDMESRRHIKTDIQAAKFDRMAHHPMNERMNGRSGTRLKRSSFVEKSREDGQFLNSHMRAPENINPCPNPIWTYKLPELRATIPGIKAKSNPQTDLEKKAITLEYLDHEFPEDRWTRVYTDGSAEEAARNGGAGFTYQTSGRTIEGSEPVGAFSTNYRAEVKALEKAAASINANLDCVSNNVVFLTDSLSTIQALKDATQDLVDPLCQNLTNICDKKWCVIQWIPAHCNLPGNERADTLAKEGSKKTQTDRGTSLTEEKTVIKRYYKEKWERKHPHFNKNDPVKNLNRSEQVTINRLRTGHCRLRAHLHRLRIVDSPQCECLQANMTVDHFLSDCQRYDDLRDFYWQVPVSTHDKLYGHLYDLRKTASFVKTSKTLI